MRNRERYIERRNARDLMITIREKGIDVCPIKLVGAEMPKCIPTEDYTTEDYTTDCTTCIDRWLNQEEKR